MKKIILTTVLLLSTVGLFAQVNAFKEARENPGESYDYFIAKYKQVVYAYLEREVEEESRYVVILSNAKTRTGVMLYFPSEPPYQIDTEEQFDSIINADETTFESVTIRQRYIEKWDMTYQLFFFD